MSMIITEVTIYVKIKDVAKRRKQLKKNLIRTFWKKSLKDFEKSYWQDSNQVIH